MPNDQCFSLEVPNHNAFIHAGAGPVDGFTFTTDGNAFHHAKINAIIEAKTGDARVMASKVFAAAGGTGVIIGTPCTVQVTAGGGVQIYAGAGVDPSLGDPSGPGEAFGPSSPADFTVGERAKALNRINDGIKSVTDTVTSAFDLANGLKGLSGNDKLPAVLNTMKGAIGVVKGGWSTYDAATGSSSQKDNAFASGMDHVSGGIGLLSSALTGDVEGGLQALALGAKYLAKGFEGPAGNAGEGLGNTTPATGPTSVPGAAGGAMGAPGDGPRIHEVAPATIDRKCGSNMTCEVGGNKTALVDGNIDYKSGANIKMNAFNKISTQSLFFEAHANVKAQMTGLAMVKVDSLGSAALEGKARFKVGTSGIGKIEASQLSIEGKAKTIIKSPMINVEGDFLKIKNQTQIYNRLFVQKVTELGDDFTLDGEATLKKSAKIKQAIKAGGELVVKGAGRIKGMCKLG